MLRGQCPLTMFDYFCNYKWRLHYFHMGQLVVHSPPFSIFYDEITNTAGVCDVSVWSMWQREWVSSKNPGLLALLLQAAPSCTWHTLSLSVILTNIHNSLLWLHFPLHFPSLLLSYVIILPFKLLFLCFYL